MKARVICAIVAAFIQVMTGDAREAINLQKIFSGQLTQAPPSAPAPSDSHHTTEGLFGDGPTATPSQTPSQLFGMSGLGGGSQGGFLGLISIAEEIASHVGDIIPENGPGIKERKGNAYDFLGIMKNMKTAIEGLGGDTECNELILSVDHSIYTLKEVISALTAVQKMNELWASTNLGTLSKCVVSPFSKMYNNRRPMTPPPPNLKAMFG